MMKRLKSPNSEIKLDPMKLCSSLTTVSPKVWFPWRIFFYHNDVAIKLEKKEEDSDLLY